MSEWMDLLRGPALGVIFMIFLLAGVIVICAGAALVAQTSLLLRLKPWNGSDKPMDTKERASGEGGNRQEGNKPACTVHENRQTYSFDQGSPLEYSKGEHPRRGQMMVSEPEAKEMAEPFGW